MAKLDEPTTVSVLEPRWFSPPEPDTYEITVRRQMEQLSEISPDLQAWKKQRIMLLIREWLFRFGLNFGQDVVLLRGTKPAALQHIFEHALRTWILGQAERQVLPDSEWQAFLDAERKAFLEGLATELAKGNAEWEPGLMAWGGAGNEHGPSLIDLAAKGKTKRIVGELEVNKHGQIFYYKQSAQPIYRIPADELYNLNHEVAAHNLPPIEKYCKWLTEYDPVCSRGRFLKLLKVCWECSRLFAANHHSQQFCRECSRPHQLKRQSDWQNVPENNAKINAAKRDQYRKKKGGAVRPYRRSLSATLRHREPVQPRSQKTRKESAL